MENRAGTWKTNLSGELSYQSFDPAPIPPENPPLEFDTETIALLVKANKQLALLDGLSSRIPNVNLFISMYVRKEALMSSQIEGTQATLEDILDPLIDENANQNVGDVINYIKATEFAVSRLKELPLCNRLIRETHAVLMEGVRGQEKNPGEFRQSQNWIGGQGSTLKDARYIPPNPEDMNGALYLLEHLINENEEFLWQGLDVLVQAALIHYQFETIHPFLDGNGRIGRLLITLFLMQRRILSSPALYISYFLKANRVEYYDRMMDVRTKGNYEQWIRFFLLAVYESATDAIETIDRLTALHNRNITLVNEQSTSSVVRLFEYLESNPIIEIGKTAKALGVSYNTISSATKALIDAGILNQSSGRRRGRTFSYKTYLDILRKGT